eukprot:CAMPEP_0178520778 /NCGR_PEP_ID=MMETSP0696-20121128/27593_1 /TAXON_ID=265572 /ORGANISM="Extubocellulus spinifer, Strain CCMP396" /LENGTH=52 /DNA_ID=CAMNT_0020151673 /DNA_START=400 /DNA_END=558 /DNA_ORIENTATION=+
MEDVRAESAGGRGCGPFVELQTSKHDCLRIADADGTMIGFGIRREKEPITGT